MYEPGNRTCGLDMRPQLSFFERTLYCSTLDSSAVLYDFPKSFVLPKGLSTLAPVMFVVMFFLSLLLPYCSQLETEIKFRLILNKLFPQ